MYYIMECKLNDNYVCKVFNKDKNKRLVDISNYSENK